MNTYTKFQEDVVRELTEMQRLGMCSKKKMEKARLSVWDDGTMFSDDYSLSVSEAADLALELASMS